MKSFYPLFALLIITGCAQYAQIYKTHALNNVTVKNYSYFFENDTIKIEYNLWSEHGVLDFTVFNKLSVPIYIDWKKSALVRNGAKLDYFIDEETTLSTTYNEYLWRKWDNAGVGKSNTVSVKSRTERISFIAPKSSIERNQFMLFPLMFTKFNGTEKKLKNLTDSTKSIQALVINYTKENTFLTFRNFLTFSTSDKFEKEFYVDNGFYVSEIMQINEKDFLGKFIYPEYEYPYSDSRWFYVHGLTTETFLSAQ